MARQEHNFRVPPAPTPHPFAQARLYLSTGWVLNRWSSGTAAVLVQVRGGARVLPAPMGVARMPAWHNVLVLDTEGYSYLYPRLTPQGRVWCSRARNEGVGKFAWDLVAQI